MITWAWAATASAIGGFWSADDGTAMVSVTSTLTNNSTEVMPAGAVSVPASMDNGSIVTVVYDAPQLAPGQSCTANITDVADNILWGEGGGLLAVAPENILWGE